MNVTEARDRFVMEWGSLCCSWGYNRAMGHVHAVLLISTSELCADDIMESLQISRGNANMNLRSLLEWGLIEKCYRTGCRKDYYKAEKDMKKVFRIIVEHRKRKEFDPLKRLVQDLQSIKPNCAESKEFCNIIDELNVYTHKVDKAFEILTSQKMDWLSKIIIR